MPNAKGIHCFLAGGIMEALLLIVPKETKETGKNDQSPYSFFS
jgi:hypothetical protein